MGLGFRVQGLKFKILGLGFRVQGFWFRMSGFGIGVYGLGVWALGLRFTVRSVGYRFCGLGLQEKIISKPKEPVGNRNPMYSFHESD